MSVTYSRTAANCPTPIALVSIAFGNGSSGPISSGMVAGVSNLINQIAAAATLANICGGGGYAILTGLQIAVVTGLNITLSAGIAVLDRIVEFVGSSPVGQQLILPTWTLPDNSTSFVWLTTGGALVSSTSMAFPSGARLFVGTVTTASGAVTNIDGSGVVSLKGGLLSRQTDDAYGPTDTPPSMALLTETTFGNFLWDGTSHKALTDLTKQAITPFMVETLAANLVLTANSPNILALTQSGSFTVTLPAATSLTPGHSFTIQNVGASGSIVVKNSAGTTVATLTAGQQVTMQPYYSSGALTFGTSYSGVSVGVAEL